jgi:hypothetical protein
MFIDNADRDGCHTRKCRVTGMKYLKLAPPATILKQLPGHVSFALEHNTRRLGLAEDLLQKRPTLVKS